MPMLDAYIPTGALTPAAEQQLLTDLTDLLIKNEGADRQSAQQLPFHIHVTTLGKSDGTRGDCGLPIPGYDKAR